MIKIERVLEGQLLLLLPNLFTCFQCSGALGIFNRVEGVKGSATKNYPAAHASASCDPVTGSAGRVAVHAAATLHPLLWC